MKTSYFLYIFAAFCFWTGQLGAQPPRRAHHPRPQVVTNPLVHDPVMACEGNTYYLFSTGWNVSCMSSTDLIHWRFERPVFAAPPQWALASVPGYKGHTWAPDIVHHNGKYHLYYSCSSFGKNTSAIGHVERTTLNPADTLNLWHDTGAVVCSQEGKTYYNAIDPSVIIDEQGRGWMSFGSFWGGIILIRLTDDMARQDSTYTMRTLACRRSGSAIEAPFLYKHGDYYYLFVSWDFCCRGMQSTYKVAVGRSKQVEGPYLDKSGVDMAQGGGTILISSDSTFVAVGHNAAYTFAGEDYFVAHGYARDADGASKLILCKMEWDKEGWPILRR